MDSCENQVTSERGLDGNLRCLGVTDFAHHNFVRVMTENGSQSASKGQSLFLIDRNLCNPANLILDWIFNSDDLVFVSLDLIDGGVQGGGFTAARGSGYQHHAIRFRNITAEFP